MEARFIRNIGALSVEEQKLLAQKQVFIAGCGGLGGYVLEMLVRAGVGRIVLADGDVFEASNLNRQLLATPATLGVNKAEAARARAKEIWPEAQVSAFSEYITEQNAGEFIRGCDAVVDALDTIPARRILAQACARGGIAMIHGAIQGWTAQAAVCFPNDGLFERLYPQHAKLAAGKEALAMTPAFCAAMQAALCLRLLLGRELPRGRLYFADLLDMDMTSLFESG